MPGVKIGNEVFVGTASVATKMCQVIGVGNPAKLLEKISILKCGLVEEIYNMKKQLFTLISIYYWMENNEK